MVIAVDLAGSGSGSNMSLPSIDELSPLGKYVVSLSKYIIDVMSGEIIRAGSLPCCTVSFHVLEGSKDHFRNVAISEFLTDLRWDVFVAMFVIMFVCQLVRVCVGMYVCNTLKIRCYEINSLVVMMIIMFAELEVGVHVQIIL